MARGRVPGSEDLLQDHLGGQVSQVHNVEIVVDGRYKRTPSVGKAMHPNRGPSREDHERFTALLGDLHDAQVRGLFI